MRKFRALGAPGITVCARPHVDMQGNQSAQIPDQTNEMGFFKDSANAEMFAVFISFSRFILDHELQ